MGNSDGMSISSSVGSSQMSQSIKAKLVSKITEDEVNQLVKKHPVIKSPKEVLLLLSELIKGHSSDDSISRNQE